MKKIRPIFFMIMLLISTHVFSGAPTCSASYGGYCSYTGKVSKIYINKGNLILVYFDTPLSLNTTSNIGLNVTKTPAGAVNVNSNPEFAKMLYSTALAAQASGRNVSMQMRGTISGYLAIDRIWLAAPQ